MKTFSLITADITCTKFK